MEHILSLSYGKDSIACLGAIEELGWPLDRIVHSEVWATDTIPADFPTMVEFKAKADGIKEVVCLNTGRTYKSAAEAARAFGTWPGIISKICLGDRESFYGYKFKYTGHEKKPRKRKQLNQNDMADMLLSYSIKARETKSKKELKKIIYELKEEMDLKKYDVTEMEMLEGME